MTSFANALEPSSRAAAASGPKTSDAAGTQGVGQAGHERCLGTDHDQVDVLAFRQRDDARRRRRP